MPFTTTTLASSALAVGIAFSGPTGTAPTAPEPPTVTVSSTSVTAPAAVEAPTIASLLVPTNGSGPVDVVGRALPGATVEVTYRGVTVSTVAGAEGTRLAGVWTTHLPGGGVYSFREVLTAVQIVDGVRSAPVAYEP